MMQRTALSLAITTATLLGLSACGGGGSSTLATPTTPPVTTVTTTFSGTAATGAAMAGATVSISCASGSGTATTAANGSYTKDLADITLPCALKAVSSDGATTLYSITTPTTTASTAQVANITPLTQLLVASLAGTDPAAFFSNFSTTASTVTAANISTAQTAVLTTLSNAGLNVTALSNLLTGALVPATTTSSGNAYDVVLDALKAQLTASGTTLATLTTTVAAASPTASPTVNASNGTASLPASLLLKSADGNCSALRTGDYWVFSPTMGGNLANQFTSGSFDAASKTITNLVGSSSVLSANGASCRYLAADGLSDVVVSQAGVLVARVLKNGVYRLSFAIPKQTITVAELAGIWNSLGFESNDAGTAYATNTFTATVGSTGALTDVTACEGANSAAICSAVPNGQLSFTSNSGGGFDLSSNAANDKWTDRAFAYRAGNGDLVLVEVAGDGSISTWTQKRTLSLPAVNSVGVGNWSVRTSNTLVANAVSNDTGYTVTAVDTAAGSMTRTLLVTAGGTDTFTQTVVQNNPRAGYNFRAATTATSAGGASVTVRERTSLNLRGMGFSVQSVPFFNAFQIGVDQ